MLMESMLPITYTCQELQVQVRMLGQPPIQGAACIPEMSLCTKDKDVILRMDAHAGGSEPAPKTQPYTFEVCLLIDILVERAVLLNVDAQARALKRQSLKVFWLACDLVEVKPHVVEMWQ